MSDPQLEPLYDEGEDLVERVHRAFCVPLIPARDIDEGEHHEVCELSADLASQAGWNRDRLDEAIALLRSFLSPERRATAEVAAGHWLRTYGYVPPETKVEVVNGVL